MSRNVSRLEMRTRARELSDTVGDTTFADSQFNALINLHLSETYDALVDAGPADYFASTTQITTEEGTIQYALEADFRSLVSVYVRESADERRQLFPMGHGGRSQMQAPTGEWTVDVEYIASAPTLDDDGSTFDGVSGWEDLIVNLVARDIMKERQAIRPDVLADIARLESRIQKRSRNRDRSGKQVMDLDEATHSPYPWGWSGASRLGCYRLRAGNLELYEGLWVLP